ncbi:hypothetical protein [Tsuneonella deserti]|nr:hypothetical protein [Tsuneonella deserti]
MNELTTNRDQFVARQSRTISAALGEQRPPSMGQHPETVIICRRAGGVGVDTLAALFVMSRPDAQLVQVGGAKGPAFRSHAAERRNYLQILDMQPGAVINARFAHPELPTVILIDQNLLRLVPMLKGMLDQTSFGERTMIWYVLDEHEQMAAFAKEWSRTGLPSPKIFRRPVDWFAESSDDAIPMPWLPKGLQDGFYQRYLPLRSASEEAEPGDAAQFVIAVQAFREQLANI